MFLFRPIHVASVSTSTPLFSNVREAKFITGNSAPIEKLSHTLTPIPAIPETLNPLFDLLTTAGYTPDDCGFCIDTSHVWTGGVPLQTRQQVQDWFGRLSNPKWIQLIHLNDAVNPIGKADKHARIAEGRIWGPSLDNPSIKDGWREIVLWAYKHSVQGYRWPWAMCLRDWPHKMRDGALKFSAQLTPPIDKQPPYLTTMVNECVDNTI